MIKARIAVAALGFAWALGGCSTVMEASRPDPVDLQKYGVGEKRMDVIARLGAPMSTVHDGSQSCDVYKLYTKGVNKIGKGAIIVGEAAADFFTLGLAEVVTTPGEAVTKNKQHTVLICYSSAGEVATITDEGARVVGVTTDLATSAPASAPSDQTPPPGAAPPRPTEHATATPSSN